MEKKEMEKKEIMAPAWFLHTLYLNPPSKDRIYFVVAHELSDYYHIAPILFSSKKSRLTPQIKSSILEILEKEIGKNVLWIKNELVFFKIVPKERVRDASCFYFEMEGLIDPKLGRRFSYYISFPMSHSKIINI